MSTKKSSETIRQMLVDKAEQLSRSEVRLGTIQRLIDACNAIEEGTAGPLIKQHCGKNFGLSRNQVINPSNIERYVDAMRHSGNEYWTGPKRVTIQNDPDLKAYVEARETERTKPFRPHRVTPKAKRLHEAVDAIPDMIKRDLVRCELAELHHVRNENDVLTYALKQMDPIKYDDLKYPKRETGEMKNVERPTAPFDVALSAKDMNHLRNLFGRLMDQDALAEIGLEEYVGRIRHKKTGRELARKEELIALKKLLA